MKDRFLLAYCFLALASLMIAQPVHAQSSQISTTVTLNYLNVQLTYPTEILPGQSATVGVQATAKDSFRLNQLLIQAYYGDGSGLHMLTSATLANNTYLSKGNQITKQITFTVPADAPRTSLVALVTENTRVPSYMYSSYYYPYSYWYFPSWDPSNPYFYYAYPPTNLAATDSGLAPLSYVKATTPEYVTLQNEYQALQQQLAQSQTDNQKLQQNLQDTTNEKNSEISGLNQQIAAAQNTVRVLEITSLILAIVAIALVFIAFRLRTKPEKTTKQ